MTDLQDRIEPAARVGDHNGPPKRNGHPAPRRAERVLRVPPNDVEAEKAYLGAVILNRKALDATISVVNPADFYKPAHGHIHAAILDLASRGDPVDHVTLTEGLQRTGMLDLAGGTANIIDLMAGTPSTSNAEKYARIIAEKATLRQLIEKAGEIAEMGYDMSDDLEVILDRAEQLLYSVGNRRQESHAVRLGDALPDWLDSLAERQENGVHGVPSGLVDLDEMTTGFRPGQLITVCARPGMGKSALGGQFAYHVAEACAIPSMLTSIEMSLDELLDRIVASQARIDNQRIRTGNLRETDWPRISGALGRASDIPLYIHDAPGATLAMLRAEVRRVTSVTGPLGLIVVDYLQLLTSTSRSENRQVEVAEMSAGLKRLARDMEVPVVALAQLNRNLENRADKRPTLADLRESGAIENDSDVVIGIYRDDYYNADSADRGIAELIVLKQRNGPTGVAKVAWLSSFGTFANMARV